jgi:hypothetical protein
MTDRVAWAERVRTDVCERVEKALADATDAPADVYVGWVAALDATTCGPRFRAAGDDGWGFPGWSAPLAGGAVGRAALLRHLQVTAHPVRPPPLPEPLEVVRDWIRETLHARPGTRLAEWIVESAGSGDRASLAATAAVATRWLSGFVRVMGWPLPDRLAVVNDDPERPVGARWRKPVRLAGCKSVTVASSPDAILGKVTAAGQFGLVVHRPSSPTDGVLADRAAFEAAAGALACGIVADEVLVVAADAGERVRCPIDDEVLGRGSELIAEVVRQRVVAQDPWDFTDATPSTACGYCPAIDRCAAGTLWLDNPSRRQGGLPVLRG